VTVTRSAATRPAAPGGEAAGGGQRYLGLALVPIATAQLMVVPGATIVNVALPRIQRALGFSGNGLEWTASRSHRTGEPGRGLWWRPDSGRG
jgi:hypothetical protein